MAFIHYTSKSNQLLAKEFADCIKKSASIFTPQFICISHSATKDWLVEQLVEQNGISANLVFQTPLDCIEMIYQVLELGSKKKDLFRSNQLNWLINEILNQEDFKTKFPEIASYFQDDDLKRFTLAEKIGGLFEKYQEFDSQLIKELEELSAISNQHKSWQSFIWKALVEKTNSNFRSFTKMCEEISTALESVEKQEVLKAKVPTVYFYGSIPYTDDLLKLLDKVGQFVSIEIFRVDNFIESNSNQFYENLSAFQKNQASIFGQFKKITLGETEVVNGTTLLETIQHNLIGNKVAYNFTDTDDSIQIASNYSVYREVEGLWNYLITQFAKNSELNQREVCVIIPSMEKYAPAIKAVFGNGQPKFNYTFFDAGYKFQDSPYLALLALYELNATEFTSKSVFGLLEYKYIREKFGFSEDLNLIKRAIHLANIRHGFEGNKDLETDLVSWRYGLKRLIYGACIEQTDELISFQDADFYPVSEFEDRNLFELMRLNNFVETLYEWANQKEQSRTLFEWVKHIENTIESFLEIQEFDPLQFNRQLESLMKIRELVADVEIPFEVIKYHLKQLFENMGSSEKIGYGGIRFISPNPYMSVPSKIYCFLGMNGSDFPRKSRKLSFDLLAEKKEYSATELDKNLFLNLILGANEKLYISYIGHNIKDNSIIPPSILIDEVVEAFHNLGVSTEKIMRKHPLHSFSNLYNSQDSNLVRFDKENDFELGESEVSNFSKFELEKDDDGRMIIRLHDLIRFVEDPIRHYYNRVLGIYYTDNAVDLAECEPFELDVLENWSIKDEILQTHLKNESRTNLTLEKKRKGQLPFKNFGDSIMTVNQEEVLPIIDKISGLIENKSNITDGVDVCIVEYRIKGNIDGIYNDTYLFATVSADKWKYRIRSAINFMVLTLDNETIINGHYVAKDKNCLLLKNEFFQENLLELLELYFLGSSELVHFTSDFMKISCNVMEGHTTIEDLNKDFSEGLNAYMPIFPSEYFVREYANGFLDNEIEFQKFKNTYLSIIGIIESVIAK